METELERRRKAESCLRGCDVGVTWGVRYTRSILPYCNRKYCNRGLAALCRKR